jgi:hypothetical protein
MRDFPRAGKAEITFYLLNNLNPHFIAIQIISVIDSREEGKVIKHMKGVKTLLVSLLHQPL